MLMLLPRAIAVTVPAVKPLIDPLTMSAAVVSQPLDSQTGH